jgi:hypothetical protein
MKTCPNCNKHFNPDKVIRIYDPINSKWIKMTADDWATGACSRKCHVKINMRAYDSEGGSWAQ